MKIFYQINNLGQKKSNFFNSKKESIRESQLPSTVKKVALGFPQAVLFDPPLNNKIYAYVIDSRGRKQYFYTKEYKESMEEEKYSHFPKIVPIVEKLLHQCEQNSGKDEVCKSVLLMNLSSLTSVSRIIFLQRLPILLLTLLFRSPLSNVYFYINFKY